LSPFCCKKSVSVLTFIVFGAAFIGGAFVLGMWGHKPSIVYAEGGHGHIVGDLIKNTTNIEKKQLFDALLSASKTQ